MCRYEDIEMVQEVVRAIRAAGAKADGSCGIHIHIGLGEHTPQSLRRLVNIVNAKEDLLTMALGITPARRERWCRPIEPGFLAELNRRKPTSMEAFARLWYARSGGTSSDWRRCAERHYDHSRYHLLNLHATFSPSGPAHTIEVPGLQRHTPRGRDQSLRPAVPRHQRTGAEHQSGQLDAPGHRQSEIHLPVLAPPAGLHRRRILHRTGTPAQAPARRRGQRQLPDREPPAGFQINPA